MSTAPPVDHPLSIVSNGYLTVTEFGLKIHRPLTWDEWGATMKGLRTIKLAYGSALADLTAHGREQFGDERVAGAIEQLEFDLTDASKALAIAEIPLEMRTAHRLTSEHAYILATVLTNPADRETWAAICAEHKLTAQELKHSINVGRVTRRDEIHALQGTGPGINTLQSISFSLSRWQTAAGGEERILKLPEPDREKALTLLKPFVELAAKLEASIAH
jgi:hypothetical protein